MKKLNLKIKDMPYAAEEALNRLRVNIKFCGKNTKKIVITSSVPNEGKSTVSVRLWKLLSEAGFPTVLVDVDLRKSEIQKKYQVEGIKEGRRKFSFLSLLNTTSDKSIPWEENNLKSRNDRNTNAGPVTGHKSIITAFIHTLPIFSFLRI